MIDLKHTDRDTQIDFRFKLTPSGHDYTDDWNRLGIPKWGVADALATGIKNPREALLPL